MKEPKKVLINGASGKMGQALIRLIKEYPQLGLAVAATREAGQEIKEDFDIVVANGQNELKDKIFRMGTLGFVCDRDLISAVGALEATLYKLGYKFELGKGVATVIKELAK